MINRPSNAQRLKKIYDDEENERITRIRLERGPIQPIGQLLRRAILLKVEQAVGTDVVVKAKFEEAKQFQIRRKKFFHGQTTQAELSFYSRMVESIDKFSPQKFQTIKIEKKIESD